MTLSRRDDAIRWSKGGMPWLSNTNDQPTIQCVVEAGIDLWLLPVTIARQDLIFFFVTHLPDLLSLSCTPFRLFCVCNRLFHLSCRSVKSSVRRVLCPPASRPPHCRWEPSGSFSRERRHEASPLTTTEGGSPALAGQDISHLQLGSGSRAVSSRRISSLLQVTYLLSSLLHPRRHHAEAIARSDRV
jgi:hypothetical protein